MVSWMWMCFQTNGCDCVARAPCNTGWKLYCSQLLWSALAHTHTHTYIYIYTHYDRSVGDRPQREREDRNTECAFGRLLSTSVWLAWMDQKDTNNKQPTARIPKTLHGEERSVLPPSVVDGRSRNPLYYYYYYYYYLLRQRKTVERACVFNCSLCVVVV